MVTSTLQLKENNLGNVEGKDLLELELLWDREGKTPERKRWLRYYYRNRQRFLAKRTEAKKDNDKRSKTKSITEEYVERVETHSGLLA